MRFVHQEGDDGHFANREFAATDFKRDVHRKVAKSFRQHGAQDRFYPLRVGGRVVKLAVQPGHGMNSAQRMVDGPYRGRIPNVALSLLQRRRDDLEVVRHPMLEFVKQIFVDARRVIELQDGRNEAFDQHEREPRNEQE